jgi:hypothetical protein
MLLLLSLTCSAHEHQYSATHERSSAVAAALLLLLLPLTCNAHEALPVPQFDLLPVIF